MQVVGFNTILYDRNVHCFIISGNGSITRGDSSRDRQTAIAHRSYRHIDGDAPRRDGRG